ncbi:unnamed protein product, partial [Allacma fusca]
STDTVLFPVLIHGDIWLNNALFNTTPAFRKAHLYQSLDIYYNAFVGTLADIKCPVPIGLSRGFL